MGLDAAVLLRFVMDGDCRAEAEGLAALTAEWLGHAHTGQWTPPRAWEMCYGPPVTESMVYLF